MSTIKVKERALLVVASLTGGPADPRWRWLYRDAESGAISASAAAVPFYKIRTVLKGSEATAAAFVENLVSLGNLDDIEAVDVFLSLHGSEEKLYFADGALRTSALARRIKDGGARNLRALYSTACFGATHAPAFVEAGFDVAAGAVGVNANAATEYPFFVGKWILGWNYENSLKPANDAFDEAQDDLARSMGFEGVDSTKIIIGDHDQKIGQR